MKKLQESEEKHRIRVEVLKSINESLEEHTETLTLELSKANEKIMSLADEQVDMLVAAQESKTMMQLLMDSIPVRLFWKDRKSIYLGCNQRFAEDAGLKTPEQIVGKSDYDLSWNEQAELYRSDDRQVIKTDTPKLNYEEPQTCPDGTHLWLRTSKIPLKDLDGKIIGMLGCYEDITERKLFEEKIKSFAYILEESLNEIYIFDTKTLRFIQVNKGARQNLGYSMEEFSSLTPLDLKPEFTMKSFAEMIEPLRIGEKQKLQFTTVHRKKDGTLYDAEVHLQLSTFQSGPCFFSNYP